MHLIHGQTVKGRHGKYLLVVRCQRMDADRVEVLDLSPAQRLAHGTICS